MLSFQFASTDVGERSESFVPDSDSVSLSIPMVENSLAGNHSEEQVMRPSYNDGFTQQPSSSSVNESFEQNDENEVLDILMVIDDSGSMAQEQNNLSTKLNPLLSFIQDTDWRIHTTTTDPNKSCLISNDFISSSDSNATEKFADAVVRGTAGSYNEQGVRKLVSGLQGCAGRSPWLRPNSNVAVLIVSDEDNCSSNGGHCSGKAWDNIDYATDYLSSIRVVGSTAKVFGLFSIPGQSCPTAYNVGTQYNALVNATGGSAGTICSSDYSNTLEQISQDLSQDLEKSVTLSQTPLAGTLVMRVNGVVVPSSGYTLNGNVVMFDAAPAAGSTINAAYETQVGSGPESSVALSVAADPNTLEVYIDGALSTDWFYNLADNTVYLNSTPAAGQQVQVHYLGPKSLLNSSVTLPQGEVRNLSVSVDGSTVSASNYSVTLQGGKDVITFSSSAIPADGAVIAATYRHSYESVLEYAVDLSSIDDSTLNVFNASGAVPFSATDSSITIEEADFMPGSNLTITGNTYPGVSTQLSAAPIAGSVAASQGSGVCTESNGLEINGAGIDFSGCATSNPSATWTVSYLYVANHRLEYTLASELAAYQGRAKAWLVSVNGVASMDYTLNADDTFEFDSLPIESVIDVEIHVWPEVGGDS